MERCLNCSTPLERSFAYCPTCSQSTHIHRFDMGHVFHEAFHALTHADKGVLKLVRDLAIRPGVVARQYVLEGKRKRYFNPFTFLAIAVGLVVLSNSIFQPYTKPRPNTEPVIVHPQVSQQEQLEEQGRVERRKNFMRFLEKRGNILIFLAVPILAFVYWLFFLKTGINFAEHLVAHVFFMGFYALLMSFILVPTRHLVPSGPLSSMLPLLVNFCYLSVAYFRFLPQELSFKFLKTSIAALLALMGWSIVSAGAGAIYIAFG